jgi:late competence protein required for DNA uptake (superfamily II DNA/RNA helicase)
VTVQLFLWQGLKFPIRKVTQFKGKLTHFEDKLSNHMFTNEENLSLKELKVDLCEWQKQHMKTHMCD